MARPPRARGVDEAEHVVVLVEVLVDLKHRHEGRPVRLEMVPGDRLGHLRLEFRAGQEDALDDGDRGAALVVEDVTFQLEASVAIVSTSYLQTRETLPDVAAQVDHLFGMLSLGAERDLVVLHDGGGVEVAEAALLGALDEHVNAVEVGMIAEKKTNDSCGCQPFKPPTVWSTAAAKL
jgi:hypothetical protein